MMGVAGGLGLRGEGVTTGMCCTLGRLTGGLGGVFFIVVGGLVGLRKRLTMAWTGPAAKSSAGSSSSSSSLGAAVP